MSDDEIPADIMQAAQDCYGCFTGSEKYDVVYIAHAIFAERERCRRIASDYDSLAAEMIG